jgi:hypothetical protein
MRYFVTLVYNCVMIYCSLFPIVLVSLLLRFFVSAKKVKILESCPVMDRDRRRLMESVTS